MLCPYCVTDYNEEEDNTDDHDDTDDDLDDVDGDADGGMLLNRIPMVKRYKGFFDDSKSGKGSAARSRRDGKSDSPFLPSDPDERLLFEAHHYAANGIAQIVSEILKEFWRLCGRKGKWLLWLILLTRSFKMNLFVHVHVCEFVCVCVCMCVCVHAFA